MGVCAVYKLGCLLLFVAKTVTFGLATNDDEIVDLPDVNFDAPFKQYAGYLSTSDKARQFFYWFVESHRSPASDPLVLWFTGGPGCSSMVALLTENGPFHVDSFRNGLYENPFSWNKIANVLYLDSPADTGFSYSSNKSYVGSDTIGADDNHAALLDFLGRYPKLKGREIYLTGESYAGIYLPLLAIRLINDRENFPKFKGVIVVNGITSVKAFYNAQIPYFYYRGFLSETLWSNLKICCSNDNRDMDNCDYKAIRDKQPATNCSNYIKTAMDAINIDEFDKYDFAAICYPDEEPFTRKQPCPGLPTATTWGFDEPLENYLNRADVRKSLHIPDSVSKQWKTCSVEPSLTNYTRQRKDMSKDYQTIVAAGIRMLLMYGDSDATTTWLGAQWFVRDLKLPLVQDTKPWFYANSKPKFAGFATIYDNIAFLTVNGAGHFVPMSKPGESLQILANFIAATGNYSIPWPEGVRTKLQPLVSSGNRITENSALYRLIVTLVVLHAFRTSIYGIMLTAA